MADVSMKDFLLQYYMQLRFNTMPSEVRAQYDVYLRSNDFRGNMKAWRDKLMREEPPGSGHFVQEDLPDPNDAAGNYHLTDEEWEKLFTVYQNALRGMAAARSSGDEAFTDNPALNDFVDDNFGAPATHLFSIATADPAYLPDIAALKAALDAHPELKYTLQSGGYSDLNFDAFKSGIDSGKYNTDQKFQDLFLQVAGFLEYKLLDMDPTVTAALAGVNISDIAHNAFNDVINPAKLAIFQANYQSLLNILYRNDKIFNVFKNHDSGKISGRIDAARGKMKYDDKNNDDYVPPKRADELTPLQQISRWADETYDNLLDKYLKFHGDRLYFSKNAQNIVKAINGAKIKPTDGIKAVLEKSEDIKKNLLYKSPTATKHFDWFTKTLNEMKATMPKAFDGALKNGRQMRAIVNEIIVKAVRDNKVEEAKTTLEVLSVIKYGATTSKIMDAMKKENMTIFSDGKLSWNKNEGVKFVSNALDKSIKAAFMGIGYSITIASNEIRLSNSKFTRFGSATAKVRELNNRIAHRDTEMASWTPAQQDQFKSLLAYWDMLETGRDSHTGAMYNWLPHSKESAQTSFDARKGNIIANYLAGYSYVP